MSYNPCKNEMAWAIKELTQTLDMKGGPRPMKKLPPSKRMSKAMRELLEQGTEGYIPREFLRLGKQLSIKGELELLIPQVRQAPEPFIPKVAQFFKGHTDLLDRLVVEMHTRGLSTRCSASPMSSGQLEFLNLILIFLVDRLLFTMSPLS